MESLDRGQKSAMNQAEAWVKPENVACNKQLQKLNVIKVKAEDQEDHIEQKCEMWKTQSVTQINKADSFKKTRDARPMPATPRAHVVSRSPLNPFKTCL